MKSAWKSFFKHVLFREVLLVLWIIFLWWFIFWTVEWRSFINSLYFTTTTMATIWFGDITPQTTAWKIFVMIYAFLWVPLFISLSWLILESRFNKRLKQYITKFYKEIHAAEMELQAVEKEVWEELWDVMKQERRTQWRVEKTQKDVKTTKRKVEKIEEIIEDEMSGRKPRWKVRKKK
jgi:CBS domain containing-hemolysin-like protein